MASKLHDPLLKQAIHLAGPIVGAYVLVVIGLLAEYAIVGRHLGASALAALGLAATLSLILVLAFHALEVAVQSTVARRFGSGNLQGTGEALTQSLILALGLGIPLSVALFLAGPFIFSGTGSAEIHALAVDYFRWRLPSVPFLIGVLALIGFFNGISRPLVPMMVYALIIALNVALCWVLVPMMGIKGAGLAQTLSAVAGFIAFLVILARPHYRVDFGVFAVLRMNRPLCSDLLRLSGPVFGQQFFGNLGMYLFVLITAAIPDGGVALAASTLARQVGYATYMPSLGFGMAAATMVGQQLGAGEGDRARRAAFLCWLLGAAFLTIGGLIYVFAGESLASLFLARQAEGLDRARVLELAALLLVAIGLYQPLEAGNTILGKALQGSGATRRVMITSVVCQWLLFLPLAWALAIPMGLGAWGATLAMAIQLGVLAASFSIMLLRTRWQGRIGTH